MVMETTKSVLIVTQPGRIQEGLQALLKTMSQIKIIGQVDNSATALKMMIENQPDLVLLATNLPNDEAWQILERLQSMSRTCCLVLTHTNYEKRQAEMMGADAVLLIGFPAANLFEAITDLTK